MSKEPSVCELCGSEIEAARKCTVCRECRMHERETLKEKRKRERLRSCGHVAMAMGKDPKGRPLEYHATPREMRDIAECRKQCNLPHVWDGRAWQWPEGDD